MFGLLAMGFPFRWQVMSKIFPENQKIAINSWNK